MPDGDEEKLTDFLRITHRRYLCGAYTAGEVLRYLIDRRELWCWAPDLDCDSAVERAFRVDQQIDHADDRMRRLVTTTQLASLAGRFPERAGSLMELVEPEIMLAAEAGDEEYVREFWLNTGFPELLSDGLLDLLATRFDISHESEAGSPSVATWTAQEQLRRSIRAYRRAQVENLLRTARARPLDLLVMTATITVAAEHGLDDPAWWSILDHHLSRASWTDVFSAELLVCVASYCAANGGVEQCRRARDLLDLVDAVEVIQYRGPGPASYVYYGAVLQWALGRTQRALEWAHICVDLDPWERADAGVLWLLAQEEADPGRRLALLLHGSGRPPGVLGARRDLDVATAYLDVGDSYHAAQFVQEAWRRRTDRTVEWDTYVNLDVSKDVSIDGWSSLTLQDGEFKDVLERLHSMGLELRLA